MIPWTEAIWIAAIGGGVTIVVTVIGLMKPAKKDDKERVPTVKVQIDAEHVATSRLLDDIRDIANRERNRP
jgi:hypothetical protein